jgi:hypothetical protein
MQVQTIKYDVILQRLKKPTIPIVLEKWEFSSAARGTTDWDIAEQHGTI